MVNISDYRAYWEQYKTRIPAIREVIPLTVEQDISKKVQTIGSGELVLFMVVPEVKTDGENIDNFADKNEGVIFVGKKHDPQRGGSYSCIEELQPVIKDVRDYMLEDMGLGCPVLGKIDINSIRMVPVSTWYNVLAGWMIDFTFES